MSALQERWAREDAFIGPRLPVPMSYYRETRTDREIFPCTGRWWAKPLGSVSAQGPFATILEARAADLTA